jgi:hypothetical protein
MFDMLAAAIVFAMSPHQLSPVDTTTVIQEDDPRWDCRTMGNLVCGPDNAQGVLPGDYSNPNCWPGAIYCPPAGTPVDEAAGEPIRSADQ